MKHIETHVYEVDRNDIALLPPGTQVLMFNRVSGTYKLTHAGKVKHIRRKTAYFIFDLPQESDNGQS